MDNLETHKPGSLYDSFSAEKAKTLWDRFEFIYTPKHGSWLNMAEIELNVLMGQCLAGRIPDFDKVKTQTKAWQEARNNKNAKINWQFTTEDARIKLKRLYPTLSDRHDSRRFSLIFQNNTIVRCVRAIFLNISILIITSAVLYFFLLFRARNGN